MVFLAMLTEIYDHILDLVGSVMAGSEPWAHWGHAGSFITDLQVARGEHTCLPDESWAGLGKVRRGGLGES